MEQIRARVDAIVKDPKTAAALKPYYPYGCKRPTFHDEYLPAFNLPHVHLVDTAPTGVTRINERGVVHDGVEYPLDVLIYATGFQWMATSTFNMIKGRGGRTLSEKWQTEGTRTFLGLHSNGFPNLFIMTGPQGGGASFNFTDTIEVHANYVVWMLPTLREQGERDRRYQEGARGRLRRALPGGRHRHRPPAGLPVLLQRPRRSGARQPGLLRGAQLAEVVRRGPGHPGPLLSSVGPPPDPRRLCHSGTVNSVETGWLDEEVFMTIADRPAIAVPAATTDLDQARQDLASTGLCVLAGRVDRWMLAVVRDALYRAADSDRRRGREVKFAGDYPDDDTNQRVWNLPSRDPVFLDLVEHPMALMFVREAIGWPALLSNISANITGPGGGEMFLHADQTYMPQPWSGIQGVNVIWCVDDFTDENGATRVVPGSHQLNRGPTAEDQAVGTVPLEAPAGSWWSWKAGCGTRRATTAPPIKPGRASSAGTRFPSISRRRIGGCRWIPSIRQFGSDDLLVLFGYRVTGFGKVNGASPL